MQRGSTVWKSDQKNFLVPDLVKEKDGKYDISGASTKISGYIKAVQPRDRGGAAGYSHVAIDILPPQPTAQGFRHGVVDTLCISIPAEMAIHNTGHDGEKITTIWNYVGADNRAAMAMPGAIVLAGWKPFPHGRNGKGPVYPSLVPILSTGVSLVRLDKYIDLLFTLHDGSPPMLHVGGPLRPGHRFG